jgi:hypothetical protein
MSLEGGQDNVLFVRRGGAVYPARQPTVEGPEGRGEKGADSHRDTEERNLA